MRESQEHKIGEYAFRVHQLPPDQAEELFLDLVKQVGPSIAAFLSEANGDSLKGLLQKSVGSPAFLAMIRELVDRLDKTTYRQMCDVLAEVSQVQMGKAWPQLKTVESEIFRGRIMLRFKWLALALKVQYAGFFDDLGDAKALLAVAQGAGAESSSISRTGSAGASGGS